MSCHRSFTQNAAADLLHAELLEAARGLGRLGRGTGLRAAGKTAAPAALRSARHPNRAATAEGLL